MRLTLLFTYLQPQVVGLVGPLDSKGHHASLTTPLTGCVPILLTLTSYEKITKIWRAKAGPQAKYAQASLKRKVGMIGDTHSCRCRGR